MRRRRQARPRRLERRDHRGAREQVERRVDRAQEAQVLLRPQQRHGRERERERGQGREGRARARRGGRAPRRAAQRHRQRGEEPEHHRHRLERHEPARVVARATGLVLPHVLVALPGRRHTCEGGAQRLEPAAGERQHRDRDGQRGAAGEQRPRAVAGPGSAPRHHREPGGRASQHHQPGLLDEDGVAGERQAQGHPARATPARGPGDEGGEGRERAGREQLVAPHPARHRPVERRDRGEQQRDHRCPRAKAREPEACDQEQDQHAGGGRDPGGVLDRGAADEVHEADDRPQVADPRGRGELEHVGTGVVVAHQAGQHAGAVLEHRCGVEVGAGVLVRGVDRDREIDHAQRHAERDEQGCDEGREARRQGRGRSWLHGAGLCGGAEARVKPERPTGARAEHRRARRGPRPL